MIDVRDNWRILLLVVLCLIAGAILLGPLGAEDGAVEGDENRSQFDQEVAGDNPTNLQYGLQLSGGTRIRGQLVGMTVTQVPNLGGQELDVEETIATELGIDRIDVTIRAVDAETSTIEVFADNVTQEEVADAVGAAGIDVSTSQIEDGVTDETREAAVTVLSDRINEAGLSGGTVTTVTTASGENFIVVEVPGIGREELRNIIGDEGRVQVVAGFPDGGEYRLEELLEGDDFDDIQLAQPAGEGQPQPHVPVSLTPTAGERFQSGMNQWGFTDPNEGVGRCTFTASEDDDPEGNGYCLYTVVDGEYVYGASMGNRLAETIRSEQFAASPGFVMQTGTFSEAQQLEINLRAGSLPTEFAIQTETFLSPSLAQSFKLLALFTGVGAWLMVALIVYYWYRDVRVAIPMLLTASAEVFLLLGFAAGIGLPLDLAHIAGLIAVIGTGLDDLIIMADEILQREQQVQTGRIFQDRFRKAFWVIGMAAATTIIAMSPLAILSLGDLRGFAIITIVGVIIGVAITRPAYGDVLRQLMLDDVKRSPNR